MCLLSCFSEEIKKHVQIKVKKRRREEKVVFSQKPREEKEEERGGKEQRRSRMVVTVLLYSGSSEVHLLIKATVLYNSIPSFYSILLYSNFHSIITPCFIPLLSVHGICATPVYSRSTLFHFILFTQFYSICFYCTIFYSCPMVKFQTCIRFSVCFILFDLWLLLYSTRVLFY